MIRPTPRVHELKSWPPYFEALVSGVKRFEVRRDDRSYRVGDVLHLLEFDPGPRTYTGRSFTVRVSYVMELEPLGIGGYVGLGLGTALSPE